LGAAGSAGCPQHAAISVEETENAAIYHNTFWNNGFAGVDLEPQDGVPDGAPTCWGGLVVLGNLNKDISFFNNVMCKITGQTNADPKPSAQVRIDDLTDIAELDNNVYYEPPFSTAYDVAGSSTNFNAYQTATGSEALSTGDDHPLIDYGPAGGWDPDATSPATNMAQWIATAGLTSLSTTYIVTAKFWHFRVGDKLELPSGETPTVATIGAGYLVVDQSVSVTNGDEIMLFDFPYLGVLPDIGAVEHGGTW